MKLTVCSCSFYYNAAVERVRTQEVPHEAVATDDDDDETEVTNTSVPSLSSRAKVPPLVTAGLGPSTDQCPVTLGDNLLSTMKIGESLIYSSPTVEDFESFPSLPHTPRTLSPDISCGPIKRQMSLPRLPIDNVQARLALENLGLALKYMRRASLDDSCIQDDEIVVDQGTRSLPSSPAGSRARRATMGDVSPTRPLIQRNGTVGRGTNLMLAQGFH